MVSYPSKITLPYAVSNEWLEKRTLAGELVERRQSLTIELDTLDEFPRYRATKLFLDIDTSRYDQTGTVAVLSSGIALRAGKRDDGEYLVMYRPIIKQIGPLPTLGAPPTTAIELIEAYEAWSKEYISLAPGALAEWLKAWETDGELDENGDYPNGADIDTFEVPLVGRVNGAPDWMTIRSLECGLEVFRRACAAAARYWFASQRADNEDWRFALEVVGRLPGIKGDKTPEKVVFAFEEHVERLSQVAFSRTWSRQQQREGFGSEMIRWAHQYGSERLKMGLTDGYRMVPVYLTERIAAEAPGFFAHLPKEKDEVTWQPRTGPSEEALRLRRAVEDKLRGTGSEGREPKVEIGWMKTPPQAMYAEPSGFDGFMFEPATPFEVIVVPNWLGRYVLFGAVWTAADDQPPSYILCQHMLQPADYGLKDLPEPPRFEGTLADYRRQAPVGGGSAADDDIPF